MTPGIEGFGIAWLYVIARIFGLCILLPFWDGTAFLLTRLSLACVFSFAFISTLSPVPDFSLIQLICEMLLGLMLSIPLLVFLDLTASLGELFDSGRGQTIAGQYSFASTVPEGVVSLGFRAFFWVVLLYAGILEGLFDVLLRSFEYLQPGDPVLPQAEQMCRAVLRLLVHECSVLFKIFLPLAVLFLIAEIFVAFFQFVLPNIPLHAESFMVKSCVGFGVLLVLAQVDNLQAVVDWIWKLEIWLVSRFWGSA